MAQNKTYDSFKTAAFTGYALPPELLETVRPWIEREFRQWSIDNQEEILPAWDLGFAELRDITTQDQAFQTLAQIYRESTQEYDARGRSRVRQAQQKFKRTAGGRVGRGFYRYALKAFYLWQA